MGKGLFLNCPVLGHVNPTLGLAKELVTRGEDITYLLSPKLRHLVELQGAKFSPIDCDEFAVLENYSLAIDRRRSAIEKALYMTIFKEAILRAVVRESRNHRFDYIVDDMIFGAGFESAQLLGIPRISSIPFFLDVKENWFRPDKLLYSVLTEPSAWLRLIKLRKAIERKFGIVLPKVSEYEFKWGDFNIIHTSKVLYPYSSAPDESFVFTGPPLPREEDIGTFPITKLQGKKVLFAALGSMITSVDFFKACIEAFKDLDLLVVLAVSKRIDMSALGEIPHNFIVEGFVPQLEVLKHTDIFICHGGLNSVQEGLYHDVPLVVVPMINDQFRVAERVTSFGAGVAVQEEALSAPLLRAMVLEMLRNDSYKSNARKLGDSLRDAGGSARAAELILEFVRSGRRPGIDAPNTALPL